MKATSPLRKTLRVLAGLVLLAGIGVWVAGGARLGWTQTSTVTMQRDEITGIDYPVRKEAFLPGVEVPAAGAALAALLVGLSFLPGRRAPRPVSLIA